MTRLSDRPGFKELLKEWNQKLFDSGFRDVEGESFWEGGIKISGSRRRYERMDEISRSARVEYFQNIGKRVGWTQFDNPLEEKILTLYAQGFSKAMIQRLLGINGHRCKIYGPIYKWLRIWGLK